MQGTEKIEAINLSCEQHSTQHVNAKSFAGMSQLKMLQLWNVRFEGQYRGFPRTLRWLRWNSQDLHCLPDELSLEDIVVLDLSCSYNMHQVWHQERSGSTKVFSQLKVLNLKACRSLAICPNFTGMPHIEELHFEGCVSLTELHPSIWQLTSLEVLHLRYCFQITALPSQPSDSKSLKPPLLGRLKVLNFSSCKRLTICPDFKGMPHIEELSLEDCDALTELHPSIWRLTSLEVLDLRGCSQITALPSQPSDSKSLKQTLLERLKVLNLPYCSKLTTCPNFLLMPHLEKLDFEACGNMTELHPSIGRLQSLTHLNLRGCGSLNELPKDAWQLTSLENLDLGYSCKIATLPSELGNLERLRELFLDGTIITALPESMRHLKQLKHLSLNECRFLKEIPEGIHSCISLEQLEARNCESLASFPNVLGDLRSLRYLNLSGTAIEEIPSSIHSLTQFYQLSIIGCKRLKIWPQLPHSRKRVYAADCCEMEEIADVSKAIELQELDLTGCQKLVDVPGVEHLRGLMLLKLGGCGSLKELPKDAWQLTSLENLDLRYCRKIATLPSELGNSERLKQLFLDGTIITALPESMRHLKQLNHLSLNECYLLKELPSSIHSLTQLTELSIIRCKRLKFLPQLPRSIQRVHAADCCEMEEIADVSKAIDLWELDLTSCQKLVVVPGVEQLRHLSKLKLEGCRSLKELPEEAWHLTSLENLDLCYCCKVATLPSQLGNSERLEQLFLDGTIITALPESMRHVKQLKHLSLNECRFLKEIPEGIHSCISLEKLEARNCESLASFPNVLGDLRSLRYLNLSGTAIEELPSSIHSLTQFYQLSIIGCKRLKFLPQLPRSIRSVYANGCCEMEQIADVSKAVDLRELDLSVCQKLVDVPGVEHLRGLKLLKLRGCGSLKELPEEAWQLTSLENLDLRYCCKIATLPSELGNSKRLEQLFLDGTFIKALPESIRHLKQLKCLYLNECHFLKEIPEGIRSCISLEVLETGNCKKLASFPNVLGDLRSLRSLNFSRTAIEELPSSIHSLLKFRELSIIRCERLKFLPQLPSSIRIVYAAYCCELEEIADVSKAIDLSELDLTGCQKLVDVPGVEQLRCLQKLKLGGCRSLSDSFKKRVQEAHFPNLVEKLTIPGSMEES